MTHPFFEELQDEIKQSPLWQSTERANQLKEILDACEAANYKHLARIDKLEQLCRDMYGRICYYNETNDRLQFDDRMEQFGLLRIDGLCDLGQDHLHNSTAGLLEVDNEEAK